MNLGERIKTFRENRHLSKSELAKKIKVSPAYITMLESGKKVNPSYDVLNKISDALFISMNQFVDCETTSFSSKLIHQILQMHYVYQYTNKIWYENKKTLSPIEFVSEEIKVNVNLLLECMNKNKDLPVEIQVKLIHLLSDHCDPNDDVDFDLFITVNREEINKQPLLSKEIKTILNKAYTKTNLDKLFDLFKEYNFQITPVKDNSGYNKISVSNEHGPITITSESNLITIYDEIIKKINSYSKFIIEEELKIIHDDPH